LGYAKIDKNKIQPSPALAALTGFLSGLNTKKKELQDREDAQNKQAVDWYKAVQEQGIKERETVVKEQGATTERQKVQADIQMNQTKLDQANQQITNDIENTKIKYKDSLQRAYEYEQDPMRKERIMRIQFGLDKELSELKAVIDEKSDEKKNKLLVAGQIAVEKERQAGDMSTQAMIQAGQDRRNREDNARMASEGALNRANQKEIALLKDSPDGKTPEFAPYVKAFDDYQNEVIYTIEDATPQDKNKNKNYNKTNITPVMQQRMDQKYGLLMDMYNKIPIGSRPTAPQRFTGTPAVLNWLGKVKTPSTYGYEGTTNLVGVGINQNDYKKAMSQKDAIKSTYKTKEKARSGMQSATNPMSDATIQKIIDDIDWSK
jgi:hypothetical protein